MELCQVQLGWMKFRLVFYSTDEHKEVWKKYTELWDGIKNETETINDGKKGEYGKDFMKIKFNTDDNLPLNFHLRKIFVRCIFEEDGKFYPLFVWVTCRKQHMNARTRQNWYFRRNWC